jgi:succinylglutamate desuccinylase
MMARRSARSAAVVGALVAGILVPLAIAPPAQAHVATPVIRTKLLGHSVRGRAIVAYELGNPYSRTKALILGQMHGDEPAGVTLVRSITSADFAVRGIDLWVVPTMNPDGNALGTRQNAHHVDLNRNWPDSWRRLTGIYYSGSRPLSQPETRAMYAFLKWLHPRYLVSLHQPLHGVDTTDGGARDPAFRRRLASNLGLPQKAFTCWSTCHGSMTGWFTHHYPGAAITVEFGWTPTVGYLTGRAMHGIITAMGGRFASLSASNPLGHIDRVGARGSTVHISGWAVDPDVKTANLYVGVYEGTRRLRYARTTVVRPGVNARYVTTGAHGYDWSIPAANGTHTYCIVYVNVGAGTANVRTCRAVAVDGSPQGSLEAASSPAANTVELTGWTFDPDAPSSSIQVRVSEDGADIGNYTADVARPDIDSTYAITGDHGFAITLPSVAAGDHSVCVTALNVGSTPAPATALGCRTVGVAGSATVVRGP